MGEDAKSLSVIIRAAAPDLPDRTITAIAQRLQTDLAGACYIKKAPAEGKVVRLGVALAAGASLSQAFAEAGVGRRQGYYLLKRRNP